MQIRLGERLGGFGIAGAIFVLGAMLISISPVKLNKPEIRRGSRVSRRDARVWVCSISPSRRGAKFQFNFWPVVFSKVCMTSNTE